MISIEGDSVLSKFLGFKINYVGFSVNRAEKFIDSYKLFEYMERFSIEDSLRLSR